MLAAGSYAITVTFSPTDTTDYTTGTATVTMVVSGNAANVTPVDFGSLNVGTTSATQTLQFTFVNPVTLGASPVAVLTQGTSGLDFVNAGSGSCAAGAYKATDNCTVRVNFTPGASGVRYGAVVLEDSSGNALATAYVHGIGVGPEVAYDGGTATVFASGVVSLGVTTDAAGNVYINTGISIVKVTPNGTQTQIGASYSPTLTFSSEGGIAVDGAGNIYVADTFDNRVLMYTPSGMDYTVGTGFNIPYAVAVDGARNVYVADTKNAQVEKIDATGAETIFASGFVYPEGVSVDSAGNVYVADNATPSGVGQTPAGIVFKYTPSGAQSIVASGLLDPSSTAVDAAGNVYATGASNTTLVKIAPTGVQSTVVTGLNFPFEVAAAANGDLYIAHADATAEVLKVNRSAAPGLSFASTNVGSTSADSPQSVTVENIGNATLNFPVPGSGTDASLSTNFTFGAATTCPDTAAAATLLSSKTCVYAVNLVPATQGSISGSLLLTDNALNVAGATQSIALSGTGTVATVAATATLSNLSQTYTGAPLSATVMTVPAGLTVTVTYNGSSTVPATAGSYTVMATVTSSGYTGSASGTLTIAKALPAITWVTPAGITQGTALSATQLDATANVAGTFAYAPTSGTVLSAGSQTLSVLFTPTDTVDYTTASDSVMLSVGQSTPTVMWSVPAAITYGTALSATQLDATASVAGTFAYTPALGATPGAGNQTLSVTFTPTDATDYASVTQTVSLVVNQAVPVILWTAPASISYGTALSAAQLNATANVAGSFAYTPASGAVPGAGSQTLSVTFTPTDTTDYTAVTKTVSLVVNQAAPVITWANPAAVASGTTLSAAQLNATANVAGTFAYSPAAGSTPGVGTDSLSVMFTPADAVDYTTATKTVSLVVNASTPVITWANPAAITYGTALSAAQLNATANVAGTFAYSPAAGAVLTAGAQMLSVTFTPTDTVSYTTATKTVSLVVNAQALTVAANSASRAYGIANPTFTGTLSGGVSGDGLTESFSTSATTLSNAGTYSIVPSVSGSNLSSYTQTVVNGTLTVAQAGSVTTLSLSGASIVAGQSETLTAVVASATSGTPTGSVQFYDGATLLNTATVSAGTASYSTTALAIGTHSITAVYSGDTNFTSSNGGAAKAVAVSGSLDFSITPLQATNTVIPGSTAAFTFTVTPGTGGYPGVVTFAATGLPAGATVTFSPSSIAANGGQQTVTVSVLTAAAMGAIAPSSTRGPMGAIALGLMLFSLAAVRKLRKSGRRMVQLAGVLLLLTTGAALTAALTGCGVGNGFFGQAQQTYTVTVTATSGTVQHSTTLTLNVQ